MRWAWVAPFHQRVAFAQAACLACVAKHRDAWDVVAYSDELAPQPEGALIVCRWCSTELNPTKGGP